MTPHGNNPLSVTDTEPVAGGGLPRRSSWWRPMAVMVVAATLIGVAIYASIRERVDAETVLARTTEVAAVSTVNVVHPDAGAPNEEVRLPGAIQAFTETPIYARTSGYLRRWAFDIGTHVRQGDLLAEIDTPEIDEQLQQARADLATAAANLKLAEITARRDDELLKTHSISIQERDNSTGAYMADKAIVASKQADVARLDRLQSYEKVYAPFDGIITERNTDIGALIDAGANSAARQLFHLSAIDRVRVFVAVPEAYSRAARPGGMTAVTLDEYPGELFQGKLVRTANAIDPASRTLLVEVDIDNPDGKLLPGAYAFMHLSLAKEAHSVTVPANALIFRKEGLSVAVMRNGKADLVPISVGRDYGNKVEVVAGLRATDLVILDPSDSLISGTPVRTATGTLVGPAQ
jgi:RND family efflux transporter MFP subunit